MVPSTPTSATGGTPDLFYQDLHPGRSFDLGECRVDQDEMVAFSRRFDPQWYHVDPERAVAGGYRGVIASGWYTASLFMRAYVERVLSRAAAAASPGVEDLRWKAAVYPGDLLHGWLRVLDRSPSASRPGLGTVRLTGGLRRPAPDDGPDTDVLLLSFRGWFHLREDAQ